jgi:POT family proton-dependent oligopeptide transporter
MGQRASTGLTTFNQFWAYVMPLLGAYIADTYLGRYKTIHLAILCAMIGHIVLTAAAAPSVIAKPDSAIGAFIVGLIILGVGTGCFKSNISPLLAEQQTEHRKRIEVTPSGERIIVDPSVTTARMFLWFYVCINVGSLVGQIAMVYAEKYVGFWLSFLLPTAMFVAAPIVLLLCKKRYILRPPTGNVLAKFFKMYGMAMKGRWHFNPVRTVKELNSKDFWERVKPSNIVPTERPVWMTYDDAWVEEVRRGIKACTVFLFMPLYWLAYGQMTNNLTSQAATMELNGVPNDIIQNLNPISIVIIIPIMDFFVYPTLRKYKINFTPIKRMTTGFAFAALSMVASTVTQYYIYQKSVCGTHASGTLPGTDETCPTAPINVWVQALPYVLVGLSEIFTNITSLEYAFTKAPANMRSLVMSINLLQNAFSSAIAQGFVGLSADPLLVWNYGVVSVLAALGGIGFWFSFRHLDKEEDRLNMLAESAYKGRKSSVAAVTGPAMGEHMFEKDNVAREDNATRV